MSDFVVLSFGAFVVVTIGWTRLCYQKAIRGQFTRLKIYCKMHAAMIASVSFMGVSIGFNWHHTSMQVIDQQRQIIQTLATGQKESGSESNAGQGQQIDFERFAESTPEPSRVDYETAGGHRFTLVSGSRKRDAAESGGHMPGAYFGRNRRRIDANGTTSGTVGKPAKRFGELPGSLTERATIER